MSNRSCHIHIINNTTVTLYRHLHLLYHGVWKFVPPEAIAPRSEMLCIGNCLRAFGDFSGKIQYAVVLGGVEYIVSAQFEIPMLGENKHIAVIGTNMDIQRRGLPHPLKIFFVKFNGDSFVSSKFDIELSETKEGLFFLEHLREELRENYLILAENVRSLANTKLCDSERKKINNSNTNLKHFIWNVKNVEWKRRLRKSHLSLLIKIVNLTSHTFYLCNDNRNPLLSLEEGLWVEFPSEQIPPLCCTEFGCQSDGFFVGTSGCCAYEIRDAPGVLTFFWDQPSMGRCRSSGNHSTKKLSVIKNAENLNEGTIIYHVLDPLKPPPLKIVCARAIPPQAMSLNRVDSFGNSSSKKMKNINISLEGFNVTIPLINYLSKCSPSATAFKQLGLGLENTNNCKYLNRDRSLTESMLTSLEDENMFEIQLVSPRAFFCSVQSNRAIPSSRNVSSNCHLYLEWKIGCEKFSYTWGPDENVRVHSGMIGGIDKKEVIMSAQTLQIRNTPPPVEFVCGGGAKAEVWVGGLWRFCGNNEEETCRNDAAAIRKNNITQDQLIDATYDCFHELCKGLQPIVVRTMESMYGRGWHTICCLPSGHVWQERNENVSIDFEGILHILIGFWNEVFEKRIKDVQILQKLQTVAIFWSNQELHKFRPDFVHSFFLSAKQILELLEANQNAKAVENMCNLFFVD